MKTEIEWNHIMDKQPLDGSEIVHLEPQNSTGYHSMGQRKYYQKASFEELLKFYKDVDLKPPDFYWVYVEDFPFPDKTCNKIAID